MGVSVSRVEGSRVRAVSPEARSFGALVQLVAKRRHCVGNVAAGGLGHAGLQADEAAPPRGVTRDSGLVEGRPAVGAVDD